MQLRDWSDACRNLWRGLAVCSLAVAVGWAANDARGNELPTTDGFYGIWYGVGASGDQYAFKYSGGLATYPQQTSPTAFYSESVDRTYFLYGGTNGTNNTLKNYLSYFDHGTGLVARPREVRHVGGNDNHRNATLAMDDDGYLWVFGNSHGNSGSGDLFRSTNPHDITSMIDVGLPASIFGNNSGDPKLAYSSPIYVPGQGMMVVYNQYHDGRSVHAAAATVNNGNINWVDNKRLVKISGQYQTARRNGDTVGVIANYHPGGLDQRTNLYYMQTDNLSQSWTTVDGTPLPNTLTTAINPALVHNYQAEQRLVYLKDINWDASGNPILMYLTVANPSGTGFRSGPQPGERTIHIAHWNNSQWNIHDVLQTKHNYNHGELYVEPDGTWRIIGPFLDGPQVYGTGGEVGVWTSQNQGVSWELTKQLTENSLYNHTYVRQPVNAHEDFYAYWADGNAFAQSPSRLYFSTKGGDVFRMPTHFTEDFAAPVLVTDFSIPDPGPESEFNPGPIGRIYEGFDYPTPGIAGRNGGIGWSGPWVDSQPNFAHLKNTGASLNSPVFPYTPVGSWIDGNGGSAVREMQVGIDLSREGTEFFMSFLFRKNQDGGTSGDNVELGLNAGGTQVLRVGSTSDDRFFLGTSVGSGLAVVGDPLTFGENYFVVVKGVASALGTDMFYATFYDSNTMLPVAEPDEWDLTWTTFTSAVVDTVRMAFGNNAHGALDEIRIGATWADVAVDAMPGDFNGDGVVDGADFLHWQRGFGTTNANPSDGDANDDGVVDESDLSIWKSQFGTIAASSSSTEGSLAVPEPGAWTLVLIALHFGSPLLGGEFRSLRGGRDFLGSCKHERWHRPE